MKPRKGELLLLTGSAILLQACTKPPPVESIPFITGHSLLQGSKSSVDTSGLVPTRTPRPRNLNGTPSPADCVSVGPEDLKLRLCDFGKPETDTDFSAQDGASLSQEIFDALWSFPANENSAVIIFQDRFGAPKLSLFGGKKSDYNGPVIIYDLYRIKRDSDVYQQLARSLDGDESGLRNFRQLLPFVQSFDTRARVVVLSDDQLDAFMSDQTNQKTIFQLDPPILVEAHKSSLNTITMTSSYLVKPQRNQIQDNPLDHKKQAACSISHYTDTSTVPDYQIPCPTDQSSYRNP